MRDFCSSQQFTISTLLTVLIIAITLPAFGQVRSSTNYQLQSDSINFGGGLSTSTNYTQESTFGEVATGESSSNNYTLKAGYQQMNNVYLAMTVPKDVVMSPDIPGIGGGISNGSSSVNVTTDSSGGYSLTLQAANAPAMQKGSDSIANYDPGGSTPTYNFSSTSNETAFAFTPEGSDIAQRYLNDGGNNCNAGSSDDHLACWDEASTTAQTIAQNTNANQPSGATTTVYFRVHVGSDIVIAPGNYVATTTVTALSL